MNTRSSSRSVVVGSLLLLGLFAFAQEKPKPVDLGGAERYATYVSTDKPIYRAGEKVYMRAVVLRADNRVPLAKDRQEQATIEIRGPKGDVVAGGFAAIQDAVAGFAWEVPASMPGGEYTIKVSHPFVGHVPGERKFDIRAYRAPRLKSQIVFLRDGYGPGDTAQATVNVKRAEGGIPANAKVTVVARVDGGEVHRSETKIDAQGNASAKFALPKEIARGEGTLAFVIEDGGVVETAAKTIPILLQTVDLTMYPEGGDLVAGLSNRIYLQAFTPAKKPADLAGVIVDPTGKEVAAFKTEHEGRGRFEFTPAKGQKYTLKINQPAGIKTTYPLPEAKETGVILRADGDVVEKGQPVKVRVLGNTPGEVRITLSKREVELASQKIAAGAQPAVVTLTPPAHAEGVMIATAWDAAGKPLAERLVFRKPEKSVKVKVTADKSTYVPADAVNLTITTTDDAGKPIGAVVGLSVTDDSVLEMIEKREQAPRLPVMVLLESDVKELADAQVYLDEKDPKSPLALDLLLGTQGWRRFAFVEPAKFIAAHGDEARRVLALKVVTRREVDDMVLFAAPMAAMDGAPMPMRAKNGHAEPPPVPAPVPQDNKVPEEKAAAPAMEPPVVAEMKKELAQQQGQLRQQNELADKLDEAEEMRDRRMIAGGRRMRPAQPQRNDMIAVREYAHLIRGGRQPNDRVDFAETLYWNAGVRTDDKTGEARVLFATSDAVTAFRVHAEAFGGDGALGHHTQTIESVQPFYTEPKMPLQVTSGDVIRLPLAFVNGSSSNLSGTTVNFKAPRGIVAGKVESLDLKGNERIRRIVELKTADYVGSGDVIVNATAGAFSDKVTRKLDVRPAGFPIEVAFGGLLGPDGSIKHQIDIPRDLVADSVMTELNVYPTPLANLTGALEQLIRQPYGCFEQTSSTSYPLVMAQQYFMSHQGVDPNLIKRANEFLDQSYQRLIGFECKTTKGFEWFGADPGHDALSAYGLLQFTDMAQVRNVDPRILTATREFVMNQRDGKGGFKRLQHTLHTWVSDPECNSGYILWSLLEAGQKPEELEKELAAFKELALKSSNSYAIALGGNVFFLAGDKATAKALMDKLAAKVNKDGAVEGGTQSVIGSGGEALNIETTSLALLAWMRDPAYAGHVEKSIQWLCEMCKGGRYGSTQSTVLALKAIVTYDKMRARPKASGIIHVVVDGQQYGLPSDFTPDTQGAIALQTIADKLTPGQHTIELRMERGSQMPYSVLVKFHRVRPDSDEKCKVRVSTELKDAKVQEGNVTEMNVTVTNTTDAAIPTPIAIIGIPGGLEVRHDQLKELARSGKIAAYEVIGREVVLYWRDMGPNSQVKLPISLIAAIPGKYAAPASRAYLYYTDEFKHWTRGVEVEIGAK